MSWVFEKSPKMGGASGEAFASTLRSSGMIPEHVLAREAIQNSVDARLNEDKKVDIRFRETQLRGKDKNDFIKALHLNEIASRGDVLGLQDPDRFRSYADPNQTIHLVYVEDYNAIGLGGLPHERTSNFYRLLLSLGDRSKVRNSAGSGGSYGFGKSVYSANSLIQTIVAYTRWVDPVTNETGTRLFGCGYYASHDFEGVGFSGRAWLGVKKISDELGETVVDPLTDADADRMAEKLGFAVRTEQETGTSILLVDAPVKLDEVRRGIEDWWWPRLVMNKLDVRLTSAGGDVEHPRPMQRPELRPFIESFKIATQQAPEVPGRTRLQRFNRMGALDIGVCGFSVVDIDDNGEPKIPDSYRNTVALIRNPLMVVAYYYASSIMPTAVGVYVAADDVDIHLKKSEPPEHNKWAPESENLRDKEGLGKLVVQRVIQGVRTHMRKFQHDAAPPPPPKQKRLAQLERALGSYFTPKGMGGVVVNPSPSPIHLTFIRSPYAVETDSQNLKLVSSFKVALSSDLPSDTYMFRLEVGCPVVEEEDAEGESLKVKISSDYEFSVPDESNSNVVIFELNPGESISFSIESEEYEPLWTVRLRPTIERIKL